MELKPIVFNPPLNVTYVTDEAGIAKVLDFFERSTDKIIGWDIETTPHKDFFWRRTRLMQFGNLTEQYVVDFLALCDNDPNILRDCQGNYGNNLHLAPRLAAFVESLKEFLSKKFEKVGVNLAFEYMTLRWGLGMRPFGFFSTDMSERLIVAGDHSLKDYGFFSMEEMMARYFKVQVDKSLQMSFNLTDPLSQAQIEYAAVDTRLPLALRQAQLRIINKANLGKTVQIENDAIGAFQDMHLHGEKIDITAWKARTVKMQEKLKETIKQMDAIFLPIVGSKFNIPSEESIEAMNLEWKKWNVVTDAELALRQQARYEKDPEKKAALLAEKDALEAARKAEKEVRKATFMAARKKRSAQVKIKDKCEGDALINYGSNPQLFEVLTAMKGLKSLDDTNDDTLVKFKHIPVIAALRDYREYAKQIKTYGFTWTQQWTTKPCKEEGWLHPGDGRLHCEFNQLDAATGRSTSSKPNGQNLPQDKEVRQCFIADAPNEDIRVSICCEADTLVIVGGQADPLREGERVCTKCGKIAETHAEEYVIVTADMSGAELRIIAELANAKSWIDAFARGEDVHSVGTELLYPQKWPAQTIRSVAKPDGWTLEDCKTEKITIQVDGKDKIVGPCAYYAKKPNGEYAKQKCDCPEHKKMRDGNKSTNFLLAYGGTAFTLAERIGISKAEAEALMALHEQTFPDIWKYLEDSGRRAKLDKQSLDMFGRRRLFLEPTWEKAKEYAKEDREEFLQYPDEIQDRNIADFLAKFGRNPNPAEKYILTHREPTDKEIARAYHAMHGSIERQGKNHAIQGSNASIAKLAMGCGYDEKESKPYLWHTLPQYRAKLLKFVHDELVVQCPKQHSKTVAALIGDAFKRAAAERMSKVVMEFDFNIAPYWKK